MGPPCPYSSSVTAAGVAVGLVSVRTEDCPAVVDAPRSQNSFDGAWQPVTARPRRSPSRNRDGASTATPRDTPATRVVNPSVPLLAGSRSVREDSVVKGWRRASGSSPPTGSSALPVSVALRSLSTMLETVVLAVSDTGLKAGSAPSRAVSIRRGGAGHTAV
jgi:hypothetical protein